MKRLVLPVVCAGMLAAQTVAVQAVAAQTVDPGASMQDVVSAVEQRLQQLGYAVTPDGQFDADLRNSVLLFQSDSGLRPTGTVDLSTLAQLGIDVAPTGAVAMAPVDERPPQATLAAPSQNMAVLTDWNYPLLKDEFMSGPQTAADWPNRFENVIGVPQAPATMVDEIAGIQPYWAEHDAAFD